MSLLCPLCMGVNFSSEEALLYDLICFATRNISCPLCSDVLQGFDKFTIHLCSHILKVDENVIKINEKLENICLQRKCESTAYAQQSTNYLFQSSFEPDLSNNNESLVIERESKTQKETNLSTETWPDQNRPILETANIQIVDNFQPCNEILSLESENFKASTDSNVFQLDFQNDIPITFSSTEGSQKPPDNGVNENCNECLLCSISFPNKGILSFHNELVHEDNARSTANRKYECSSCQKKFKMRGSLLIHLRVAHQIAGDNLIGSNNELSEKDQDQQYYCNKCFKFFKKEHYLQQHLKVHDEKQWNCDECGKLFTTKYFLKRHKRLHTGEMPYTCPICEKHFTFQQSYHRHISYHNNEKPYSCEHCGRSFKELSTLYNHQRIHTGEKPYSCDVCGKRFRQRVSCLVHSRIHTGSQPYKCASCHKSYRYKVSLKNHKCILQEDDPEKI